MIRKIEEYFIHEDQKEICISDRVWFWGVYAGTALGVAVILVFG